MAQAALNFAALGRRRWTFKLGSAISIQYLHVHLAVIIIIEPHSRVLGRNLTHDAWAIADKEGFPLWPR